nr:TetR-like C-terminal domain-containing protein [Lysinibacillus agricola]
MPFLIKIAHFCDQDIEFYLMLISTRAVPTFLTKLKGVLIEKIISNKETLQSNEEREVLIYRVHFFVGGLMSLYQDWFTGKFECTLEELNASVSRMMIQGFQSYTFK